MRGTRKPWRSAIVGVVVAGTAACSGSVPASRQSQPSARLTAPPAMSSSPAPRDQALQAYLGMWHAFVVASQTADYQSAELSRYAAGDALSVLTHGLYQNYQLGIVTRGQPSLEPTVTMTSPPGGQPRAAVLDCANSSRWREYYKSGKPAGIARRGLRRIEARLQPFDGAWKVTYLLVMREGTC